MPIPCKAASTYLTLAQIAGVGMLLSPGVRVSVRRLVKYWRRPAPTVCGRNTRDNINYLNAAVPNGGSIGMWVINCAEGLLVGGVVWGRGRARGDMR